jgi:hypothetical protein
MKRFQELEMRRFTDNMWALLCYAGRMHPMEAEVFGNAMRSARILERRGFLAMTGKHKFQLTELGHEAIRNIPRRMRSSGSGQ